MESKISNSLRKIIIKVDQIQYDVHYLFITISPIPHTSNVQQKTGINFDS